MAQLNLKSVPLILRGEFFEILECDNDKVTAKCKTCQSSIKGGISTTSNFTTHLQSQHPEKLKEYKELKEGGGGARKRQKILDFPVLSTTISTMKPKLRSRTSSCLFCFRNCSGVGSVVKDDIFGASNCILLKKQLQNFFILRNLLDFDSYWCEETLLKRATAENDVAPAVKEENESLGTTDQCGGGDLESWFKTCDTCIQIVSEAWRIHEKLIALQTEMNRIKQELRGKMKEKILENASKMRSGYSSKRGPTGIEKEIRTKVFPELLLNFEPEEEEEESLKTADAWYLDFYDEGEMSEKSECSSDIFEGDSNFVPDQEVQGSIVEAGEVNGFHVFSEVLAKDVLRATISGGIRKMRGRPKRKVKSRKSKNLLSPVHRNRKFHYVFCPHCNYRFRDTDQEQYQAHLELHEKSIQMGGNEFDCSHCSYPAQDSLELDLHVKKKHFAAERKKRVHSCPKCDFQTKTWKILKLHAKLKHGNMTDEELGSTDGPLVCQGCSQKFMNSKRFTEHQRAKHPELLGIELEEVECPYAGCDLKFISNVHLQYHIHNEHKSQTNRFQCDTCGKGFQFLSRLEHHKISHVKNIKRDHVCHLCGVDYPYKDVLTKHYRTIHPEFMEDGKGDGNSETAAAASSAEPLKCKYCPMTTPYAAVMKRHLNTHKEELGFKCPQCKRCYTNEQGLKRHIRINHSGVKVPCPYCNRTYPSVEYMKDHVRKFCKLKELKQCISGGSDSEASKVQKNKAHETTDDEGDRTIIEVKGSTGSSDQSDPRAFYF